MVKFNPNRDIIEDRELPPEFDVKDIQFVMTRGRIVTDMMEYCIHLDTFVFNYYYPRFSKICWVLFHIFIHFFRAEYLLTYLLSLIIFAVVVQSEWWIKNITPINNTLFFADNMLHPSILATNNILTADNLTVLKKIQTLQ